MQNYHLDIYYFSHFLRGSRYSINENDNNNSKDNNNNSNNKKHDNKSFRLLIVRTQHKKGLGGGGV